MTVRIVDSGWESEFTQALSSEASELRIICPFIKLDALAGLLSFQPKSVQVITRFNLKDIANGVSDIDALKRLLAIGARVRGVLNLHAKLYILDKNKVIITSANLTKAGLTRNHELGLITDEPEIVAKCRSYFEALWQRAREDLERKQLDEWSDVVEDFRLSGGRTNNMSNLKDHGIAADYPDPLPVEIPIEFTGASQGFVKFLGSGKDRVPLSSTSLSQLEGGACHWAACYPTAKRPRGVRDGAIIFMGRFISKPRDIRVFGRAIGMRYKECRDDATPADIKCRKWMRKWSRFIRVYRGEFVDGTLENGVSLKELMDTLKADSFVSTQRNALKGAGNTDPKRAYGQQAAVELSPLALSWLNERLQAAFDTHGKIAEGILSDLDWPDPSAIRLLSN